MAIVWSVADLLPARAAVIAGVVVIAIFAVFAFTQAGRWKNTDTLFTHTLAVTGPNPIAEYVLGGSLETAEPVRAIPHLRRAIDLTEAALRATPNSPKPDLYAQAHVGIGTALLTEAKSAAARRRSRSSSTARSWSTRPRCESSPTRATHSGTLRSPTSLPRKPASQQRERWIG